jgi:hypothetical protein
MTRNIRRLAATTGLLLAGLPGMAAAQFQIVVYGAGEWDTHDQAVYVLGLAGQTTSLGFGPTFNLLGYIVNQPDPAATIKAFNPSAGIQYRWTQSAIQARVGYTFVDTDSTDIIDGGTTFGGSKDGLSTTGQYIYWGTGERTAEILANMNWGDDYFWARGRANQRIVHTSNGGLNLGGEVVGQGNSDNTVFQVGPTAELSLGRLRLLGVVGWKFRGEDARFDDGPYFKAEFVLIH